MGIEDEDEDEAADDEAADEEEDGDAEDGGDDLGEEQRARGDRITVSQRRRTYGWREQCLQLKLQRGQQARPKRFPRIWAKLCLPKRCHCQANQVLANSTQRTGTRLVIKTDWSRHKDEERYVPAHVHGLIPSHIFR